MTLHALVVTYDEEMPPDVHGPFSTVEEAQLFAENYRDKLNLPREATPEHNDEWTEAGWYFGIVPLTR